MFHSSSRIQVSVIRQRRTPIQLTRNERGSDCGTNCKISCQENLRQYLLESTLHGLKYVGNKSITLFERVFFGLMFAVVVSLSVYFILHVWYKYSSDPMIISLNPQITRIREMTFPAVTVCNMNLAMKSVVENIPTNSDEYLMIQSLCRRKVYENVTQSKATNWESLKKLYIKVTQPCEKMLLACRYGRVDYKCTDLFETSVTDEGLCCTFNSVTQRYILKEQYKNAQEFNISKVLVENANDWSFEKGWSSEELKTRKFGSPRLVPDAGIKLGLTIVADVAMHEYYCSWTHSYGLKVLIHSPDEFPLLSYDGKAISNGYETHISLLPTLSTASEAVRKLPVSVRKCLFEEENYLTYFRKYTRDNCLIDCITKILFTHCNCILFYMPLRFDNNIRICRPSDEACVQRLRNLLYNATDKSITCNCLPKCFEIVHDTDISTSPLLQQTPFLEGKNLSAANISIMHIYYSKFSYRSQKRDELIGFTEFLSNTGGLLGLFLGFSVFSIIEIFYFSIIRPCSNCKKVSQKRHQTFRRAFRRFKLRSKRKPTWLTEPQAKPK